MKTVTSTLAGAALVALGALAFVPEGASAAARKPAARSCEAAAALKLVGEAAPDDARVRQLTGAKKIRRVKPGQAVTMDYSPDRVTLEIVSGRIVSTSCG
ncbi:I78 family peptidase inhibitor [Methylopila sp. M107]|uniref:I78 family peptidase inhibitor n=1 Tax=Methylopila sp. M107 TaxID=1101190 RepID=UPI0003609882|nr:I78 family peptidase inhibitor [Methylopila sp. M107]